MFVVIDGIDGSGKGTQIELVKKSLEKQWKSVYVLDYPRYWEKSAYFVEKYLNGAYGEKVDSKLSSLFYALDRFDSSFDFTKKMGQYDYILSNRYVSASMIHQGWKIENLEKRKEFLDWLYDLEYNICKLPKPDVTLFLLVEPKIALQLIKTKDKRDYIESESNVDIHEKDKNHLKNAYNVALEIGNKYPDFQLIDCSDNWEMMSRETITNLILDLIKK